MRWRQLPGLVAQGALELVHVDQQHRLNGVLDIGLPQEGIEAAPVREPPQTICGRELRQCEVGQ
jgi:hypothetical protein